MLQITCQKIFCFMSKNKTSIQSVTQQLTVVISTINARSVNVFPPSELHTLTLNLSLSMRVHSLMKEKVSWSRKKRSNVCLIFNVSPDIFARDMYVLHIPKHQMYHIMEITNHRVILNIILTIENLEEFPQKHYQ